METLAFKLNNITKSYQSHTVLDIEELSAYQGDIIGVVGGNGSGKSTLLRIISGEVEADTGTVQREVELNYLKQMDPIDEHYRANELDPELISRLNIPTNDVQTLSGGESNKYRLAQVLSVYKMGLLLDEPTTHLDQLSIDYLIQELT